METPKTRGEELLETLMARLEPDSPRYRILASAKQFKSSWVDLGEQLTQVHRKRLYREWGYSEFDDYCSREIRIRKATADKLTRAYHFMETDYPERLAADQQLQPLPDFRAVDLLCRARQEQWPEEELAQLHKAVFEEQRSLPTIRQHYQKLQATRSSDKERDEQRLRSALQAVRRLQTALAELPELAAGVSIPLQELEGRLAEALPGPRNGDSAEQQPSPQGQDQGAADAEGQVEQ